MMDSDIHKVIEVRICVKSNTYKAEFHPFIRSIIQMIKVYGNWYIWIKILVLILTIKIGYNKKCGCLAKPSKDNTIYAKL